MGSIDDVDIFLHIFPAGLAEISKVLRLACILNIIEDLLQVLSNNILVVRISIPLQ